MQDTVTTETVEAAKHSWKAVNYYSLVLGAVIGWFIRFFIDGAKNTLLKKLRRARMEKKGMEARRLSSDEVVTVTNSMLPLSRSSLSCTAQPGMSLIVPFPKTNERQIRQAEEEHGVAEGEKFAIRESEKCLYHDSYEDLVRHIESEYGLPGFSSFLKRSAAHVANGFTTKHLSYLAAKNSDSDEFLFNGSKFGVLGYSEARTPNRAEDVTVRVQLYKTDYYSKKVLAHALSEYLGNGKKKERYLAGIKSDPKQAINLRPVLFSSFGVNVVVRTADGKIILVDRATRLRGNRGGLLHISANEGLSSTDDDQTPGTVSLVRCLERALWEELGIESNFIVKSFFYDSFITLDSVEFGMTAYAEVSKTFDEIKGDPAPDRSLEVDQLHCISAGGNLSGALEKAGLQDRKWVPHGMYTLRMIWARHSPDWH